MKEYHFKKEKRKNKLIKNIEQKRQSQRNLYKNISVEEKGKIEYGQTYYKKLIQK